MDGSAIQSHTSTLAWTERRNTQSLIMSLSHEMFTCSTCMWLYKECMGGLQMSHTSIWQPLALPACICHTKKDCDYTNPGCAYGSIYNVHAYMCVSAHAHGTTPCHAHGESSHSIHRLNPSWSNTPAYTMYIMCGALKCFSTTHRVVENANRKCIGSTHWKWNTTRREINHNTRYVCPELTIWIAPFAHMYHQENIRDICMNRERAD